MSTHTATSSPGAFRDQGRSAPARLLDQARPFLLLALRVLFGYALIRTGYGKLTHLDGVTRFFAGLGIPAPGASAALVGAFELGGGILLVAGLGARLAALVLTGVLTVALLTAHTDQLAVVLSDPGTFIGAEPVPYLAAVLVILVAGPGRLSLDRLIRARSSG